MSSEESEYEDQEDSITGEEEMKLVAYAKRQFSWERSNLTSIKAKLDKVHNNNHTCTQGILVGCQADLLLMAQLGLSGSMSILTDISQLLGTH